MNATTVLEIFKEITKIPRESGHEGPMTDFLVRWAESRHLSHKRDAVGNVLIVREATPGKEHIPTIVLQGHQDMVCEKKPESRHDFAKDPIPYVIRDGWMIAEETTLGADDGIGIAACLALLDSDLPTGRLECVFTVSEETAMDGAENMEPGFFDGKVLINLDSEDEGQLFIGCAGGINTHAVFHYTPVPVENDCVRLNIGGALGGHSGDDINKERMNAVQQMARFLYNELEHGFRLVSFDGGNKSNAIARDCEAILSVPKPEETLRRFESFGWMVRSEFSVSDPDAYFTGSLTARPDSAVDDATAAALVRALTGCMHGVIAMSQDIPGFVETSTNLASVKMEEGSTIRVVTSQRSSGLFTRRLAEQKVRAVFELAGAELSSMHAYPGWKPNVSSHILEVCVESYRRLFHTEPEVKSIHAGLECGLFLQKFPGLDMISFGPTLRGVHAPGERMELASLDKFVDLLIDVVCHFK